MNWNIKTIEKQMPQTTIAYTIHETAVSALIFTREHKKTQTTNEIATTTTCFNVFFMG